jgi:hypothetical protein
MVVVLAAGCIAFDCSLAPERRSPLTSICHWRVDQEIHGPGSDSDVEENLENEKGDARQFRAMFALG